jgi:hypothetical protein
MNFKKSALLALALSFSSISNIAFAEEVTSSASANTSSIISELEKGLTEVGKSDFSAAQIHLKAARTAAEPLAATSDAAKQAYATLIQGQIKAKVGDVAGASEIITKAISQFKAL